VAGGACFECEARTEKEHSRAHKDCWIVPASVPHYENTEREAETSAVPSASQNNCNRGQDSQ